MFESPVGNISGNAAVVHKVLILISSQASTNITKWWRSHWTAAGANSLMTQKSEVIIMVYFSFIIPQVFVCEQGPGTEVSAKSHLLLFFLFMEVQLNNGFSFLCPRLSYSSGRIVNVSPWEWLPLIKNHSDQ